MSDLNQFLKSSAAAADLKLDGSIILKDYCITPAQLNEMKSRQEWPVEEEVLKHGTLSVGGVELAKGSIIEEDGTWFFQVDELLDNNDSEGKK